MRSSALTFLGSSGAMTIIETGLLSKAFRVPLKGEGVTGALRAFVKRSYRDVQAVSDFTFSVQRGELVGLLGPNGAGKTTLMKMLTGIIAPSSGDVQVLGFTPFVRPIDFRKRIALVMGQKSQLWWDIPAIDSFLLLKSYYEIPEERFRNRLKELGELLQVQDLFEVHVRRLSLGERMKMELMACLLHDPEVLFLDEPTIGLDVVAQRAIRHFLLDYQARHGTTMVLTSHYMADVEALCSRVVLIIAGQKHFDGNLDEFSSVLGPKKSLQLTFSEPQDPDGQIWREKEVSWNASRDQVEIWIAPAELRVVLGEILARCPVLDISTDRLPIERVMTALLENPALLSSRGGDVR